MKKLLPAMLLAPLLFLPLHAGVTTYPDPPNAVTSSDFSLTIDGIPVTVMDYMDYHYAHFAFDGTVGVTVGVSQPISNFKISPASLGIQGQVNGGSELTFSLDQVQGTNSTPRYLVLQINGLGKLVILGDPPETDVPPATGTGIFNVVTGYSADSSGASYTQPALQDAINAASSYGTPSQPGIVYVPPGIYKVRADLRLKDNIDLYLAPGSVLKADDDISNYFVFGGTLPPVLTVDNADNVTIRGRGEVDASGIALMDLLSRTPPVFVTQSTAHPRRRIIRTNNGGVSNNVRIDGVVCKDATGWSVELKRTHGVQAQNVKVLNHKDINWKIENDGINVCSSSDALVNQCFVMTIDDATCSKATDAVTGSMDNVIFSNNVLWNWSAGVKTGMQNDHPMNGVVFRNIDVVHCRRAIGLDTKTSQAIGQTIPIEGILFDGIRVEEIEGHWNIANHDAVEFQLEDAGVNNVTIRNLSLPENRPLRCGPNYPAADITFQNLVMNSELITNVSQVTLAGNRPINNLVFETAVATVVLSGPPVHTDAGFQVTATFSEPVTGLVAGDFEVTHGSVQSLTGGPSIFTLTVQPSSTGWISVRLPAGVAQNSGSQGNLVSNSLNIPRAASAIPLPVVASGTLYLKLTADELGLADGEAVRAWSDPVSGRELTGTATLDAGYANGHAGVRFNGTSDVLGNTSLPGAPNAGHASLFIVGNFTSTGNDSVSDFMVSGQYPSGTASNRFRIFKRSGDGRVDARVGGGSTIAGAITDTGPHVIGLISGRTTGAVSFVADGLPLGAGSSGSAEPLQAFFLGAYGIAPNQFFDGTIAEVLLYDGSLSATDSTIVQDYLTRKYFGHALDSDTDGLPDTWEMARFGNLLSSSGASSDSDADSVSDALEWLAGTDPTQGDSFFSCAITSITQAAIEVSFLAIPDRRYTLESSTGLSGWKDVGSLGPLSSGGPQTFLLGLTGDEPVRFVRVGVALE